uniref:EIPR1-like beta-propeller domain-containing protein n=2 Tax=Arcella intermedia TaxID=1963864 RepID=A0A6B2L8I2_9EUKA
MKGETKSLKCILWRPKKHKITDSSVIAVDSGCISCWDLNTWKEAYKFSAGELGIFTTGVWNPHNAELVMYANGSTISASDLRQPTPAFSIPSAHGERSLIRDMDCTPDNPNFFASCGDDSKIKFWDQRKPSSPVKVFSTHSHWVWKVQFHPYFDSLAISSSSDKSVCLWDVRSISRETTKRSHGRPAKLVKSYQSHDESVYSVCWSGCDMDELSGGNVFDWNIFASVAYDGRVIFNRVPHDKTTAVIAGR